MAQENAETFPFLVRRDSRYGQTGATCCERKGPTAYSISFRVGFIKNLGFAQNHFEMRQLTEHESGSDSTQTLESDHMANGRVETAVREVKRQCRILRISAKQNTSVRIADDSPLLGWHPPFCSASREQNETWQRWKTSERRRTGRSWKNEWRNFERKVWFRNLCWSS